MGKLVCGVGVNDADYIVQPTINGKRKCCPFYRKWKSMIVRCYDDKFKSKFPTYIGCTVCEEWLTFSNFKRWMESKDWEGKELDKDLLTKGNKVYSPASCVFISQKMNKFLTDSSLARGEFPLGVTFDKEAGKYRTQCQNPLTGKIERIGRFIDPESANEAWRKRKHELSCQLADLQKDERIAQSLRARYSS